MAVVSRGRALSTHSLHKITPPYKSLRHRDVLGDQPEDVLRLYTAVKEHLGATKSKDTRCLDDENVVRTQG
jgi:hypothetical protein